MSPTFHGRDIFAPVSAYLVNGGSLSELGDQLDCVTVLNIPLRRGKQNKIMGIIIDIDHFGNIITNHKIDHLKLTSVRLNIGSRSIEAFDITYRQTPKLVALIGSHGYLEVALAGGNAAKAIGANVGDLVELSVKAADLANSSLA